MKHHKGKVTPIDNADRHLGWLLTILLLGAAGIQFVMAYFSTART